MPSSHRTLTAPDVAAISDALFAPCGQDLVGVELEWPVHRAGDLGSRPTYRDLAALDGAFLDAGGRVTIEPGGQIELSTAPFASVPETLRAARVDSRSLFAALEAGGLACDVLAVDDRREPRRILTKPRYRAMESFFSQRGEEGLWMMANTTATQVNISHDPADPAARWHLLHRISPVLIAAFANSPGVDANGWRWASLRQAIWWSIDPTRTRPVPPDPDPARAWLTYALAAQVMFIAATPDQSLGMTVAPGLTFGQWITHGHTAGWPTTEDFRTHLSTLFPPVRPRGWLELRVLDALPEWIREVAVLAVAAAGTPGARAELSTALPNTGGQWRNAIRDGMADPCLAGLARRFFEVVGHHLDAVTTEPAHAEALEEFRARYVNRDRCPGDDLPVPYDMRAHHLVAAAAGA